MNIVLAWIHLINSVRKTIAINLSTLTDEHNEAQGLLVTLTLTKTQSRVRLKQESRIQGLDSSHYLPATNPITEMNILLLSNALECTLKSEEL